MKWMVLVAMLMTVTGCSDAERATFGVFGVGSTVTCYSGGVKVYEGESTGKVRVRNSGYAFTSKATGQDIRTNADCVIATIEGEPAP